MTSKLKTSLLLYIFLSLSVHFFAQKKALKNADLLFLQKRYPESAIAYSKIYSKNKDKTLLLKLGDSYFLYQNYQQAQLTYSMYFNDSLFENIPQYFNYAKCAKQNGNVPLMVKLNKIIFENTQDAESKSIYDNYSLYTDSLPYTRSYDLDSNYCCIELDASSSIDSLAAPLFYLWDFGNGKTKEGIRVENCFPKAGEYKVVLSIMDAQTGYLKKNDTTLIIELEEQPVKFKGPSVGKKYFFLSFDASMINLPAYKIKDYIWDMGNGDTFTGTSIKYKYLESGSYQVRLSLIVENIFSQKRELLSAYKTISIRENYEEPSKTFADEIDRKK